MAWVHASIVLVILEAILKPQSYSAVFDHALSMCVYYSMLLEVWQSLGLRQLHNPCMSHLKLTMLRTPLLLTEVVTVTQHYI